MRSESLICPVAGVHDPHRVFWFDTHLTEMGSTGCPTRGSRWARHSRRARRVSSSEVAPDRRRAWDRVTLSTSSMT